MSVLNIAVKGGPRTGGQLRSLTDNLDNLGAVSPEVFKTLEDWQVRVFASAGDEAGTNWPNYTKREAKYVGWKFTALREAGLTPPDPPLLRWGRGQERLWPSLTGRGSPRAKDKVREEKGDGDGWVFGTAVPYAAAHQYGKGSAPQEFGGYPIPKRTFLNVTDDVAADIKDVLLDFIT